MTPGVAMLGALAILAGCSSDPPSISDSFEDMYNEGVTFDDFMADATARKELWDSNYVQGIVSEDVLARARALSKTWRILAVAEDWCSDSVSSIPFLALLTEQVNTIELRIVDSEVGLGIMEAHLTPDGRPATPTVLILDAHYEEAGCWVERPAELQQWAIENREALGDEFGPQKMAWYKEDAGHTTLDEVLGVIEAADRGERICHTG